MFGRNSKKKRHPVAAAPPGVRRALLTMACSRPSRTANCAWLCRLRAHALYLRQSHIQALGRWHRAWRELGGLIHFRFGKNQLTLDLSHAPFHSIGQQAYETMRAHTKNSERRSWPSTGSQCMALDVWLDHGIDVFTWYVVCVLRTVATRNLHHTGAVLWQQVAQAEQRRVKTIRAAINQRRTA